MNVWIRRVSVCLLLACYSWVLPSHRHAHADAGGVADTEQAHQHDHDHDHGHGHDHPEFPGDNHDHQHAQSHCEVCYAARTMYAAPLAASAVRAPDLVDLVAFPTPERVLSVRPIPAYDGRAPPSPLPA